MPEIAGLPQIQYMLACENVTQDMAQNLTFSGVLETLGASAFPTMTPSFYVVFGIQNVLPGVYTARVSIAHSDSNVLMNQELNEIAVTSKQERARFVIGLRNFAWPEPGRYTVKLYIRNEVIGAFSLDLVQQAPPNIFLPPNKG